MNTTTVSRVHAVDQRSTIGNNIRISSDRAGKSELPLIKEIKANSTKVHSGTLGKITDSMRQFAAETLRPESNLVGGTSYETSASRSRKTFNLTQSAFASGVKDAIRKYAKTALESVGPPVKIAEADKTFRVEAPIQSLVDRLRDDRHVNAFA